MNIIPPAPAPVTTPPNPIINTISQSLVNLGDAAKEGTMSLFSASDTGTGSTGTPGAAGTMGIIIIASAAVAFILLNKKN
jgi:hypothetical protein